MTPRSGVDDRWIVLALAVLAWVWIANSSGIVSSNDGSHLALARALVLRGQTPIDPDRALTLEVDLAERDGHAYSDRPPGTAFAALGAVWLGDRLDPAMYERAMTQARAGATVDPLPGPMPYISTYSARIADGSTGPQLARIIGTSIAISIHAVLVGLLGLVFVDRIVRRVVGTRLDARLFALACLGLASAWGPYSTALFSHVSAATAVAGLLLGIVTLAQDPVARPRVTAALIGLAGTWAIACDYLLLLAIVPTVASTVDWRRWGWVALGTSPMLAATLAYHTLAFGGPLAVGYDHQSKFEFARGRASTFSGDLVDGLWTLWGLGRGAGVLAQAPIVLVGVVALASLASVPAVRVWKQRGALAGLAGATPLARVGLALLGFTPWLVMLGLHRTPWGGGTGDHRYLIPMLPLAGIGLALAWTRASPVLRGALITLALASTWLVWRHFLGWHEAPAFARPGLGILCATPILLIALGLALRRSRQKHAKPSDFW